MGSTTSSIIFWLFRPRELIWKRLKSISKYDPPFIPDAEAAKEKAAAEEKAKQEAEDEIDPLDAYMQEVQQVSFDLVKVRRNR